MRRETGSSTAYVSQAAIAEVYSALRASSRDSFHELKAGRVPELAELTPSVTADSDFVTSLG